VYWCECLFALCVYVCVCVCVCVRVRDSKRRCKPRQERLSTKTHTKEEKKHTLTQAHSRCIRANTREHQHTEIIVELKGEQWIGKLSKP
jgi:hypothetical protein